ncbi:EC1118_1K5_0958p [Saccharomyces cerevisiae EC1118]|uniref:EC1118_1K5_0958p n=1 Tax=Saccharomyces cerevisiae (strain Lalvin EC1118 / Prise de mousse) TaxID=643680 RepID=C8ZC40_YEAS8|nr:EC1118_1K5_0958p [Saccharomyces cerevisiae EC1118]
MYGIILKFTTTDVYSQNKSRRSCDTILPPETSGLFLPPEDIPFESPPSFSSFNPCTALVSFVFICVASSDGPKSNKSSKSPKVVEVFSIPAFVFVTSSLSSKSNSTSSLALLEISFFAMLSNSSICFPLTIF